MRPTGRSVGLAMALLLASTGSVRAAPASPGQPVQSPEYEVKAAYLFNFAKFVDWPPTKFADDGEPIRLCVYGRDPFELALAAIDGRTVRERRLVAEHIRRLPQADRCHLLFIPRREFRSAGDLLARVADKGVLTVTEFEEGDHPRGIINLVRDEGRVGLQIAAGRATAAGLRISSRLLQLAEVVDEPDVGDD